MGAFTNFSRKKMDQNKKLFKISTEKIFLTLLLKNSGYAGDDRYFFNIVVTIFDFFDS